MDFLNFCCCGSDIYRRQTIKNLVQVISGVVTQLNADHDG
jgi:hypothetical protein